MEYRGDTGDPYVQPETGVLRNLAGITDSALLEAYEGEMSIMRQVELAGIRPPVLFDFEYLKEVHRYLFQDVYAWAGEPRTVDMAKGSTRFGSHLHVESYLTKLFNKLAAERELWLRSPEVVDWAARFAEYLGEINAAHSFREGNGRTQRLFIGRLANEHGFEIRWDRMRAEEMIAASIASFDGNGEPMKTLIERNLVRLT